MRLFEKCWTQLDATTRAWFHENAAGASILDVDSIARDHTAVTEAKCRMGPEHFPFARAPWDRTFCEFSLPDGTEIGILAQRLKPGEGPEWTRDKTRSAADALFVLYFAWKPGQAPAVEEVEQLIVMNHDGLVEDEFLMFKDGDLDAESKKECYRWLTEPMLLAFSFANCKNVTKDLEEDDTPAKIRRRLKLPEVKHYTLTIDGRPTKRRRGGASDPQEGIVAFHLCRGHFAHYREDAPMFGRKGDPRFVGRFWHPPRVAGKKEKGEVTKDYIIKAAG